MSNKAPISKNDIWKAIWLSENSSVSAATQFLRSLIIPAKKGAHSSKGKQKLALIVGHNSKAPGAYAKSPINQSEFTFNTKVANLMAQLAESDPDLEIKVFFRKAIRSYSGQITEVCRRVNAWKPDATLSLHFNWLNGAGRIEMICFPTSTKGKRLAEILLDKTGEAISGAKKLLYRGRNDRGGLVLALTSSPIVMTEPFDCSNKDHLATVNELGPEGIARINYDSVKEFLSTQS